MVATFAAPVQQIWLLTGQTGDGRCSLLEALISCETTVGVASTAGRGSGEKLEVAAARTC